MIGLAAPSAIPPGGVASPALSEVTMEEPARCACGRERSGEEPARGLAMSPVEAGIHARLEAIRARRLSLAEEMGDLAREEQELRARLASIVHAK